MQTVEFDGNPLGSIARREPMDGTPPLQRVAQPFMPFRSVQHRHRNPNHLTVCQDPQHDCRKPLPNPKKDRMTPLNREDAAAILANLQGKRDEMLAFLTKAARLESPSQLPDAQGPVFDLFAQSLTESGFRCRRIRGRTSGGQLLAVPKNRDRRKPQQLILGHVDTVWPLGTLKTMPVESREGRLHGPGVYDMKAGLVQAIFALRALNELDLEPSVTPVFLMNSDEEIGSRDSVVQIERLARVVNRTFVMEPSLGPEGKLKTQRKGVGRFTITVLGRAAHAGLDPEKGISAVHELSHVIQALFALNDTQRGTSVNVGVVSGGMRPNVIAPECRAEIDVRVTSQLDADVIEKAIHQLPATIEGTELRIEGRIERPPLEATPGNRLLWDRALDAADRLGLAIQQDAAGGGSDGNWTSLYCPTLDGLGAVGDGAHAVHEHVLENKIPERSALLACLLMEPGL